MLFAMMTLVLTAEPVNLECQMHRFSDTATPADHPWNWQVAVSEGQGRVDVQDENGRRSVHAVFTATTVSWENITLSRVDLSLSRVTRAFGAVMTATGRCRIADPVSRAF